MSTDNLTAAQIAEHLGEPLYTIRKWARTRLIPSIRLGHRTRRYDLEAVKAALVKRTVKAIG